MNVQGGNGPRIGSVRRTALCALAAAGLSAALPVQAQQPTQPPAPQSTNLGTLVVAPQKAPTPATGAKKLLIQRSSLNLNIQATPPQGPGSGAPASAKITPPVPLRIVPPRYPRAAYRANASGSVTVTFTVKRDGRTTHIRIVKAEPPRVFDAAARAAVRAWRYRPATREGKPVPMPVTRTLVFTPPEPEKIAHAAPPRRSAPGSTQDVVPSNVHPLYLVPPQYPSAAYRAQEGGKVTVQFVVTRDGRTANIRILAAIPPGVFNAAAISAVRQWRFQRVATPTQVVQTIQFNPPGN